MVVCQKMKVIWEQLIEAASTYTDFKIKYNISAFKEKKNFFSLSFLLFFLDCWSTKLLRLFPAICQLFFFICLKHISIDVEVWKPMLVLCAIFLWKNQEF